MKSVRKYVRISPKKVNVVASLVRKKSVPEALTFLEHLPKKAANEVHKAIHSAASNAVNNFSQKMEELSVQKLVVVPGPTLKRMQPVSKGRGHAILKRTSHIFVEVGVS